MRRKKWFFILVLLLLLAASAAVVQAQSDGAIRGTVYLDANGDGVCGSGDAIIAGVPVEFAPDGGKAINLASGDDGTFGLVAVTYGTWRVTAKPSTGQVTNAEKTYVIVLSAEHKVAEGVNFCVSQTGTGGVPPTTLPESGASLPPMLIAAAVLGIALLIAGLGLILRDRRATS